MKYLTVLIFLVITCPAFGNEQDRYLNPNKVIYEEPQEDEVLKINTSIGYTTVLEFPEKPSMVTTGDSSLLQIEVPKNSKNVLIKALRDEGETNLFVFTPKERFNYKVFVGNDQDVDYVVDVQRDTVKRKSAPSKIPVNQLIKMAQNYKILKESKQINERLFVQKDIFLENEKLNLKVKVLEGFSNKNPHYLILHALIHNKKYIPIELNEKITNVYVNGQRFKPTYVLFDKNSLDARQETEAWVILEDTHISLDNQFTIGVGVYDKEYIF